ncbi:MAG: hypothetical protein ACHRHE_18735 [Tepidisphaerales bacterium]
MKYRVTGLLNSSGRRVAVELDAEDADAAAFAAQGMGIAPEKAEPEASTEPADDGQAAALRAWKDDQYVIGIWIGGFSWVLKIAAVIWFLAECASSDKHDLLRPQLAPPMLMFCAGILVSINSRLRALVAHHTGPPALPPHHSSPAWLAADSPPEIRGEATRPPVEPRGPAIGSQ